MKKIGYVLSGGGARGFAHLGVLKLLEELNIKPYAISGTSAGAIVGALYAAGKKPVEILELMKKKNLFGLKNLRWKKNGFFSMKILKDLLKETISRDDFNALNIKLFVAVTELNKGKEIIFSSGSLFQAVTASASIPVLFEPVVDKGQVLVDGGIMNNFPVEPLEGICDVIIGCHVNKIENETGNNTPLSKLSVLERSFHLSILNQVYSKINKCDLFIEPVLSSFKMYDVKKADLIFEKGYTAACEQKEKLLELTSTQTETMNL